MLMLPTQEGCFTGFMATPKIAWPAMSRSVTATGDGNPWDETPGLMDLRPDLLTLFSTSVRHILPMANFFSVYEMSNAETLG